MEFGKYNLSLIFITFSLIFISITQIVEAAAPSGQWWNTSYQYRKNINITAGSKNVSSGYPVRLEFDHTSLVSVGKSQADGDDIRTVYWNGSSWTELGRVLANGSSWNNTATKIMFKTQAQISANSSDDNYYIYYGNSTVANPPTSGIASARYYVVENTSESTTTSTTYSSKVQLQFTPGATSEQWVVVASWRQRRVTADSSAEYFVGKTQVRLNGVTRTGNDFITYKMASGIFQTVAVLFKINGTTSQQTVNIDYASYDGSNTGIDDARILAFMIPNPSNANIQYKESLSQVTDQVSVDQTCEYIDSQTLTFSPSASGDYIWMANGFFHEGPGGATCGGLYATDESGTDQQNAQESYIGGSDGFVHMTHFQKTTLTTGSKTFKIRHQPDRGITGGSHRQGLTQLLFRTDVFDALENASSTGQSTTGSQTYQTKVSLTTASQTSSHDYVYLTVISHDDSSGGTLSDSEFAEIRVASSQKLEGEKAMNRSSYDTQVALGYGETNTGGRTIDARYRTGTGLVTAESQYAHIIALRYIEPNMSLGSEEDTTPPQWSNNVTSPTEPATYSQGQSYQFNVTWTDAGISVVLIEHNLTGSATPHNDTVTTYRTISGNKREYYFNANDLKAGTYVWKEYANDTVSANNWNSTPRWTYTVNKASSNVTIISPTNGTSFYRGNSVSLQSTIKNQSGTPISNATVKWYNSTTNILSAENGSWVIPAGHALGSHIIIVNATHTNYTTGSAAANITINNALPQLTTPTYNVTPAEILAGDSIRISCDVTDYETAVGSLTVNISVKNANNNWSNVTVTDKTGNTFHRNYSTTSDSPIGTYTSICDAVDANSGFNQSSTSTFTVYQNGTIEINMNATKAGWGEPINISITAKRSNSSAIANGNTTIKVGSRQKCSGTTDSNGKYSCIFNAPNSIGRYTVKVDVTDPSTNKVITNTTTLDISVSIGSSEAEQAEAGNVGCVDTPRLFQNPDGTIKTVFVRICVWR